VEDSQLTLALAGDTMLGRGVARTLATTSPEALVAPEVQAALGQADLVVLNLECCISERGRRWEAPGKPFFFRAPPRAVELLVLLGVDCVTLANNHALDYGVDALADTLDHLAAAGIATVGAGADLEQARRPAELAAGGLRVAVLGVTDHPADFAAGPGRPGVAFADLGRQVPGWLAALVREAGAQADVTLVTPHWGPNMTPAPVRHVRRAAGALVDLGATLIAGHSAHVPHGIAGRVLYDLGDFLDDYRVDPRLRNDLGLLFLVTLDARGPLRLEALPLKLEFCHTRLAVGQDAAWMRRRFRAACAELGTSLEPATDRLVINWR
jgi:poly-gamma-glutamate capsule biosynthesis protein CapA/YwtB (metallophosphatase superfamily)